MADGGLADQEAGPPTSLRTATSMAKPGIAWVGAATSIGLIMSDPTYDATLQREFNYLTPENDMKWGSVEAQQGVFTWGPADQLVAYAQQHGMRVKGHNLVWYNQLPAWVSALTDATVVRQALVDHITTEVTRFKGQVAVWDVVNEAVLDDASGLRPNVFLTALGASYIDLAFQTAHAADPDALLVYNDYNGEGRGAKSDAIYTLVQGLVSRGVPIGGVGLQMHIDASHSPAPVDIQWNMQRLEALGLRVNFSEMDVRAGAVTGDLTAKLAKQQSVYHGVVAICVAEPKCDAVTFWGFTDAHTWVDGFYGPNNYPLLFDTMYAKKPAYSGVFDAMLGN